MRRGLFVLIASLAFFAALASQGTAQADPYEFRVEAKPKGISDGDTANISIRFYGIDTPEKQQQYARPSGACYRCGQEAKKALKSLIGGEDAVFAFTGGTTYGRPVATVFVRGKDMNLEMVKLGWATVYEQYISGQLKIDYLAAQDDAKAAKLGVWQGDFIMPYRWRRGDRLACE